MTAQCREDNDTPEHTTGTVSALELASLMVNAERIITLVLVSVPSSFSALTLLVGSREGHPGREKPATLLVVWHSGRTSVFCRQIFAVLHSTCS